MHRALRFHCLAAVLAALVLTVGFLGDAAAYSSFFSTNCSSCHSAQGPTCNGCHHHKGTLVAVADKASYYPGDQVSITLSGGTQTGWFRALLYDQSSVEIARADYVTFPTVLVGAAPALPGDYVWNAAWYGNNDASGHVERRAPVTIHVVQSTADAPDDRSAVKLTTWGRLRSLFRR
jgi:hypothetical protein